MKYYISKMVFEHEKNIRNKLYKNLYREKKERFLKFNIYNSWWSRYISPTEQIRLTYRRFLQLANIFKYYPSELFCDSINLEEKEKFLKFSENNESITRIIKVTKLLLKKEFESKKLKKTTFLLNSKEIDSEISTKTLFRVFNKEHYTEFTLSTFLIISEGLEIDFKEFFNKILEVINSEYYNKD
ncbi:MAG: hypothetical protein ACRC3I_08135 [Cetobacterium sp.]